MGSSSQLPGPHKSGGMAIQDRTTHVGAAPQRKATPSSRARPKSSIPELLDGEARYRILADQTKDGILLIDSGNRRIIDVNAGALHLFGYQRSELIGALISKLVAREGREAQRNRVAATPTQISLVSQARYRRKDGSLIEVEIQERRLKDGRVLAVIRGASQEGLAQGQYGQMLTRFDLLVATFDRDGRISYANAAMSALTGWSVEELIGRTSSDILPDGPPQGKNRPLSPEFWAGNLQALTSTEIVTRSGERRKVAVSASLLQDQYGNNVGAAILGQDITQGRAALTELKREIRERAGAASGIAKLQPGGSTAETALAICTELRGLRGVDLAAVVAFSVDGATTVLACDAPEEMREALEAPAPAVRNVYLRERADKGPWVERWKERVEDGEYGAPLARAGLHSVSYAPIWYADRTLGFLVVGSLQQGKVSTVHDNLPVIAEFGPAASALLGVELHANQLADELRRKLREIISTAAFHPVFQPIIDLDTGLVVGYEALTRFADGEPPSDRFSAAWSVGSGVELELATLDRAILVGRDLPSGRWLSVNISPRLLTHLAALRRILTRGNRPIVLEITEHVQIPDYGAIRMTLQKLSPARISVDDAGSGFTNFAHIVDLQPDFVKIDIGLVRGVDADPARQAMIVALCHFARSTNCQLIAEGVETRDEARTIKALGVTFGQGYWYGRPLAIDAFSATPKADPVVPATNSPGRSGQARAA